MIGGYRPEIITLRDRNLDEISIGYFFLTSKRFVYYPLEPKIKSTKERVKATLGMAKADPSVVGLSPFIVPVRNVTDVQYAGENHITVSFKGGIYGSWTSWEWSVAGALYGVGDRLVSLHSPGPFVIGSWSSKETRYFSFPALEEAGFRKKYDIEGWMSDIKSVIENVREAERKVASRVTRKRKTEGRPRRPKFCPNCGSPVELGDNYCTQCGHKLI